MNYNIYKVAMAMLFGVAFTSCSETDDIASPSQQEGAKKDVVLFSAGNEALNTTRAATVLYMPNGVRFAAAMYYQESENYNLHPVLTNMQVDANNLGNSNYYKSTYDAPEKQDNYKNDAEATIFYWQNRQPHIFIGYIDNYNAASASAKTAPQTYLPSPLSVHDDFSIIKNRVEERKQACKHFDLRNPDKDKDGILDWTCMADQYDPLIACMEQRPEGASAEVNRVYLTFKHQFSQIQVNLRNHESVSLLPEQIDGVELLGVSEYADVFPFVDHKDKVDPDAPDTPVDPVDPVDPDAPDTPAPPAEQEIVMYTVNSVPTYIRPAEPTRVNLTSYTPEQLEQNPYGTSFTMFEAEQPTTLYLKTFEAIAYGNLAALRIHWHELDIKKDENGNIEYEDDGETPKKVKGIEHNVTFVIPDAPFRELKSGKRYVFNLEIRRGTLAVVRTVIDDWITLGTTYSEDGTISE